MSKYYKKYMHIKMYLTCTFARKYRDFLCRKDFVSILQQIQKGYICNADLYLMYLMKEPLQRDFIQGHIQ